ncbi:hypothetical protein EYF80_011955 [Liparis tanakae]|uniref:Uncharacterized protein n=1 Tax=Liparis tanakae TaxID=230148 RepID=A0A4Z2IIN5_9TELE|nr:hypothetical protein EYF80_011955 [Liparis tanakae]
MRETSVSSFWWNSSVTSFFPVAHWDTLDSGTSKAALSFTSNDNSGPVLHLVVRLEILRDLLKVLMDRRRTDASKLLCRSPAAKPPANSRLLTLAVG